MLVTGSLGGDEKNILARDIGLRQGEVLNGLDENVSYSVIPTTRRPGL